MNYFGNRDDFAIEIGESMDASEHCRLDFYVHGIHLNREDNQAHVPSAISGWPHWEEGTTLGTEIFWELPFSAKTEELLERVMVDNGLFQSHQVFALGPVSDSFSMLAFRRPSDYILIFIRNDGWDQGSLDLAAWNVSGKTWCHETCLDQAKDPVTHWLSVTVPSIEFEHLCESAYGAIKLLYSNFEVG
jgi:hypothetical protein